MICEFFFFYFLFIIICFLELLLFEVLVGEGDWDFFLFICCINEVFDFFCVWLYCSWEVLLYVFCCKFVVEILGLFDVCLKIFFGDKNFFELDRILVI